MQKIKVVFIALFIIISTFMNIDHYIFAEEEINDETSLDIIEDGQVSNQVDNEKDDKNTYLVESSLSDVINRIKDGESLVIFIGSKEDENLKVMIKAYKDVIEARDDIDDDKLIYLTNGNDYTSLLNFANDVRQKEAIEKAFKGEYAIVIFTYNKEINVIYDYQNLNSSYSPRQLAMAELASAYLDDAKVNETNINENKLQIRPNIMAKNAILDDEYEGPYYDEGYTWKYASKSRIQEFTAPVSGTYYIELWGADGDSDSGVLTYGINASKIRFTTGIGGGGAKVTGYIHLDKGETIYLALGPRNSMRGNISYNGGGAGYGQAYGFRAGGGSAGSIYTSIRGNGELINYKDYLDEVLMVAGGGGGAEDFFTALDISYYCNDNYCATSYGGNAGEIAGDGKGSGANGKGGAYDFGIGQSYAASNNSSSGGGGGGLYGGTAGHDTNLYLRGGSGGAGSSYINENLVSDGIIYQAENIKWYFDSNTDIAYELNAKPSGASIKLNEIDKYPLIINYLDINTDEKIIESHQSSHKYGDIYSIPSPIIDGYTLANKEDSIIEAYMPDNALELDVYYDYPNITVHYKEYKTEKVLNDDIIRKYKKGEEYNIITPNINGYELYDDSMNSISGIMPGENLEFVIYYVKEFKPSKHIVAINDISIIQDNSDRGVQLKTDDIVTYEIRYHNNKKDTINKMINDKLTDSLTFIGFEEIDSSIKASYDASSKTINLNINIKGESSGSLRFKVKVNGCDEPFINNWDRKDPRIKYEVIKSADPKSTGEVGYNQEITYYLTVKNLGLNPISNIVVIDKIPDGSKYLTSNSGEYISDGNYIRFLIDELAVDEVIKLSFKVQVITQVEDDSTILITNKALYNNFNDLNGLTIDETVLNKGIPTNEIVHKLVGPKLTANKSANPMSGSIIDEGDEITYIVDITNDGNVDSNYLRIIDEIPKGTEYIRGSASLSNTNMTHNEKYMVTYGDKFDIRYHNDGVVGSDKKSYYDLENIRLDVKSKICNITITYPRELLVKYSDLSASSINNSNGNIIIEYGSSGVDQKVVADDLEKLLFISDGPLTSPQELKISFKGPDVSEEYINYGRDINIAFNTKEFKYYLKDIDLSKLTNEVSDFTISWPNGLSINSNTSIDHDAWDKEEGQNYLKFTLNKDNTVSDIKSYLSNLYFTGTYGIRGKIEVDINVNIKNEIWEEHDLSKVPDDGSHRIYMGVRDLGTNADFKATQVYVTTWCHTHAGDYVLRASNNRSNWINLANFHVNGGGSAQTFIVKNNNTYRYYEVVETRSAGSYSGQWWQYILKGYRLSDKKYTVSLSSDIPYQGEIISDEGVSSLTLPTSKSTGLCEFNLSGNYIECKTADLRAKKDHAILTFKVKVLNPNIGNQDSTIINRAFYESVADDFDLGSSKKPSNKTNEVVHIISSLKPEVVASKSSNPVSSTHVGIKQEIEYYISINNITGVNAPYTVVREYLPDNVDYVPNSISDNGVYVYNDGKAYVEWVLENIKGNDAKTISYKVKVVDEPDYLKDIEAIALYELYMMKPEEAGSIVQEPNNMTNKTIHSLLNINDESGPMIEVTKTSNPSDGSSILRQSEITYTLSIENIAENEKAIAPYILIRDYIPEGTRFKTIIPNNKDENVKYHYDEANNCIEWKIEFLKPKSKIEVQFIVTVNKEAEVASVNNYATYGLFAKKEDINGDKLNERTNEAILYLKNPTIDAYISANPRSGNLLPRGKRITYTISLTNSSDALANYVNIENYIPEGTIFIPDSIITSKFSDDGDIGFDHRSIQYVLYDLKPQETRTVSFDVEVDDSVKDGEIIRNKAFIETSIIKGGDAGGEDYIHPTIETNEVMHTLELNVDTIATGGEGWNKIITVTAIGFINLAILFIIYYKKEIKH